MFQARFCKSRRLAADLVADGHFRLNSQPCAKPGQPLRPGDVLTFPRGHRIRVIRVLHLGQRRGPAAEAQALYQDLDPDVPAGASPTPLE